MRSGPGAVKLRIANVSRFQHLMGSRPHRHAGLVKNTAEINIFEQIAPYRRSTAAAVRDIDEKGRLAYKPRQLSAMTRSDRGGSIWAGNGPIGLASITGLTSFIRQIARSAENDP